MTWPERRTVQSPNCNVSPRLKKEKYKIYIVGKKNKKKEEKKKKKYGEWLTNPGGL